VSREYLVTITCDHDCSGVEWTHLCQLEVKWEPDGVNDTDKGWHVDYEATAHIDDAEPEDYCGSCWAQLQSEAIAPHKEGE